MIELDLSYLWLCFSTDHSKYCFALSNFLPAEGTVVAVKDKLKCEGNRSQPSRM